jgi:predicted MFS family arabinose efflux permease
MPLGALLGGLIGEAFGLRTVFIAMTALGAVLLLPAQLIRQEQMGEPAGQ